MKPIIHVQGLSKTFRAKQKRGFWSDLFAPRTSPVLAVRDVNFSIARGESVAFLGPNGAGKTTTIKMLSGLIHPTSGSVSVLGFTPFERKFEFLSRIGLVMGNKAGLNWDLTSSQSFWLLKQIYQIPDEQYEWRLQELTELLDIDHVLHTQLRNVSLGERMKMELIGSILHEPEVLFLDEPTIGLDIIAKQKMRQFLREIQKKYHITLLLTSHDMDDVEQVCDRVIVINHGSIVHDGALEMLFRQYHKTRYVTFIFDEHAPPPSHDVFQGASVQESSEQKVTLEVDHPQMPKLIGSVTAQFQLADIEIHSVPLEEVIADLFHKKVWKAS